MTLDRGRWAANGGDRFDDVGVQRALGQILDLIAQAPRLLREDIDKGVSDDLALRFRVGDLFQLAQKKVTGVGDMQVDTECTAKEFLDFLGFLVAHKSVVHVDAVELAADGLVEQGGHDGGVDPATQAEQDMVVAHGLANRIHSVFHELGHFPVA